MGYEHLQLNREAPHTERYRKPDKRPRFSPPDPRAHGSALGQKLTAARYYPPGEDIAGFDERKLIKIKLRARDKSVPDFRTIPGLEVISQEDEAVVLAFATEEALNTFESRLATLACDGKVTRKELLYAIDDFAHWTPQDRVGAALREQDFPTSESFLLDVELWPQERSDKRRAMLTAFVEWLGNEGMERLDDMSQPSLVMVRLRCNRTQSEALLHHRDVRTVDLPPQLGVSVALLQADINQFPSISPPADTAPAVAVLDSGLTTGHPLLGVAVGDAQGFLAPDRSPDDLAPTWHGTFVGGLALYGDIQANIKQGSFIPQLRLFSGKVFEDNEQNQTGFVEKAVEEAVQELKKQYGCRVFNLSYGDRNKVYDGRHLRGLAYTLDRLTRDLGVLFVVPTGNLLPAELPTSIRENYPDYLLEDHARLLDPATALNVLTVGGLSRHEASRNAQRRPDSLEDIPVARSDQPFPLTRSGFSINGAIKPDVVEHAGNIAINPRAAGQPRHSGLGVLSLNGGFASGFPFKEDIGTSYAAPQIAHKAAKLLAELPDAGPNLLRALIGAHAHWPTSSKQLIPTEKAEGRDKLMKLIGYGRVDEAALFRSLDHTVSLLTEEYIGNDQHQFFELPLPADFWAGKKRGREITVAIAYSPTVRTTRLDYRSVKLSFSLVTAASLEDVTEAFRHNREEGMPERSLGRWISNAARKLGTLQVSRWQFKAALKNIEKVFVVVTRQDSVWSDERENEEPYALVAVLSDRENAEAQLYAQVRAALAARVQVRARARIGGRA